MKNSTHSFKFKKLLPSKNMFFGNRNLTATEILFFRSNNMKKHLSLFLLGNCSFEHYKMVRWCSRKLGYVLFQFLSWICKVSLDCESHCGDRIKASNPERWKIGTTKPHPQHPHLTGLNFDVCRCLCIKKKINVSLFYHCSNF